MLTFIAGFFAMFFAMLTYREQMEMLETSACNNSLCDSPNVPGIFPYSVICFMMYYLIFARMLQILREIYE